MFARMFEGLEWKPALRRGGIYFGIYLLLLYVLNTLFPGSFGFSFQTADQVVSFLLYAAFFFLFFVVIIAFTERSKKRAIARRRAASKGQAKGKPGAATKTGSADGGEGAERSELRGRNNPNTSRKKASRRRRR